MHTHNTQSTTTATCRCGHTIRLDTSGRLEWHYANGTDCGGSYQHPAHETPSFAHHGHGTATSGRSGGNAHTAHAGADTGPPRGW